MAFGEPSEHNRPAIDRNFREVERQHPNQEARGASFPGYRRPIVFCTLICRNNQLPLVR